ncbi:MAG: DNA polymerase Y family protein [Bauldia sp.]
MPYLSTDRIRRLTLGRNWRSAGLDKSGDLSPLVVVGKIKNALRLVALDAVAERFGLVAGQPLAEARAMIPSLDSHEADEAADADLLGLIADWSDRYTPLVAYDETGGLLFDITGCAHLLGGEAALVDDLTARLRRQGIDGRAAIADTVGLAFAAARFGGPSVVASGEAAEVLAPMPLSALRLPAATVFAMSRVGLKTVGQILEAPRAPLASRFGCLLIDRLDQALGLAEEAISPRRPPPVLIAERNFAEPIARQEDIEATLASLAGRLQPSLEEHGLGARLVELSLFRVDGAVTRFAVGTGQPVRDPVALTRLFREKLKGDGNDIDAGFGFDLIRLAVPVADRSDPAQTDLTGSAMGDADLAGLIDRLGARLGPQQINRLKHGDSHWPERAMETLPAMLAGQPGNGEGPEDATSGLPIDRPIRLFARPEPVEVMAEVPEGPPLRFRWRRALYQVVRAEGPERIAPEWWRFGEDLLTRDYFRVEDKAGHRFWLFRQGLYDRESSAPAWFLHGLFA